ADLPKPLVRLAGRALLDHVLDRIAAAGIGEAVVNVHHLADTIEKHLATRTAPRITISDEREALLETGGGLIHALPLLGDGPWLVHNSDSVWIEQGAPALPILRQTFDPARMDGLLLLAERATSLGYGGRGDFHRGADGRLERVGTDETAEFVFAGASIATQRLVRDAPRGKFSLNRLWDRAIAEGRLYGVLLDGTWMHVGDPSALEAAERLIATWGRAQ
ncbi:MAG: nucleotidyltransferase family protein, partial [Proteobacteria bacterium]|nr:nucleotidyltransferase family protein [Pseudomonadota bacterium]